MSCHTRRLGDLLPANPTGADKRALDGAIRRVLGVKGADCPQVWATVKEGLGRADFASSVRAELEREI